MSVISNHHSLAKYSFETIGASLHSFGKFNSSVIDLIFSQKACEVSIMSTYGTGP